MNILFIGMPGAGKSTLSYLLSHKLKKSLVEIDDIIKNDLGMQLQEYIDLYGNEKFKEREGEIILSILKNTKNSVISPPGSIIYYPKVMNYLKNNKDYLIIYLECSLMNILSRTNNFENRGVVIDIKKKDPFISLYHERIPCYEYLYNLKYNNTDKNISDTLKDIENMIDNIVK
jgi:shikimate kinase|tara:strand:- start:5963 stop:6484 length:522 start_codon:yes stop_codon:yes gene_type:complete